MTSGLRRRTTGFVLALVLVLASVLAPTSARAQDLNEIYKQFEQQGQAGNYVAAERLGKQAADVCASRFGRDDIRCAWTLHNLAVVYQNQGKYDEAEGLSQRALAIEEKALGRDHPDVAQILNNLANVYADQGKYGEAAGLYQRALAIREKAFGRDHPDVARTLNNLAIVYADQGKYGEAAGLFQRALAIREKALGRDHPDVALTLNNLANVYADQDKYDEAEGLFQRALAIKEKALGRDHPDVADTLNNLAIVYRVQGKYGEAEGLYQRALGIEEKALGRDHPHVADILNNLAIVYRVQGKYGEAEGLYQRALAIREKALGRDHPVVALTLNNLAILYDAAGNSDNALAFSRKATAAVIAHAATQASGAQQQEKSAGLVEQRADYFRFHVANLAAAARKGIEPDAALGREGLEIAQWAAQSSAAAALQQMATRSASGGALAGLVREKQDLAALWRDRDKRLIEALSKPETQQNRAAIEQLRKEIGEIESRSAALAARLEREFPDYAALASPRPLKAEEVQQLLGADEALIFWLGDDKKSYVFALTRDDFAWKTIPVGTKALEEKVAAFRRGLDVEELKRSTAAAKPELFDLGLAHELYAALFGPIEGIVKDKPNLLVVPSGPLTSLPFHLLVTETPAVAVPELKDVAAYRDAAWLIKGHAVTMLPSLMSLKALRVFARKEQGAKPMVGFGDPVFRPEQLAGASPRIVSTRGRTRAYTDYWQGKGIDRARLSEALPALPDTARELKAVAKEVGAPAADIHFGRDASETTVKRTPLADYRIVYFATHGLVAGDVKGLGEPALALSIPKEPSDLDDGLLTASEVAQLRLAADWVVLSACNTAAGEKPGAEALSGLARAFFYAGARALLVSHWAVDSDAATRLTTSTFRIMKADAKAGRAEALRRSMLDYMTDGSNPWNPYPAFWGPFALVGEGAAK